MITFTTKDDNKQFISINTDQKTNINVIINSLKKQYPSLKQLCMDFDESEIIIPVIDGFHYGFSLNELRKYIRSIAVATVSHFCVDIDIPSQRYCG